MMRYVIATAILAMTLVASSSLGGAHEEAAAQTAPAQAQRDYSPNLDADYPDRVLFGDTHLHTAYSFDAGLLGNRLGPDEAYRFAKGEEVRASLGQRARLRRPLDFLVVADHSESLGIAPLVNENDPRAQADPVGRRLIELVRAGDFLGAYRAFSAERNAERHPMHTDALRRSMWDRIVAAAETHNQPGRFTAFIGYEYTSNPETNNLHRVVMFRDGAERAGSVLPFSSAESMNPEDLWTFLEGYERATGGRALAIPHNGNLSNGLMFADATFEGQPLDRAYAERRRRWEPLTEVTQIKGDGETHPLLSPNDEFANYYRWDRGNFGQAAKTPEMLPREYARAALLRGLGLEARLGINPFQFGMIGSSDSHTSLAGTAEDNFFSKATPGEPGSGDLRYNGPIVQQTPSADVRMYGYQSLASGLVGVWARANTREEIFDAMARREVFATTGTRLRLRMFGGWDFTRADAARPDLSRAGYGRGAPMGSVLPAPGAGQRPTFLIEAMRDPDGANLDRIQVVKGWLDASGATHERIYNVVWSGNRRLRGNGLLPSIGSTVRGAEYDNSIGAPSLTAFWVDPDFDPAQRAFYYVRVLEIPTPTWLAYDMAVLGPRALPADALLVHQERAYGSPIWYSPS
jgi:Protein of unknown function (DUF3604)